MRIVSAPGRSSVLLVFQMSPVNAADMTRQLVHYSSALWTGEVRVQAPSYQHCIVGFRGGKRGRARSVILVLLSDSRPFASVTLSEARGNAWCGLISSFHIMGRSTGCLDDQAAGGLKDQPAGGKRWVPQGRKPARDRTSQKYQPRLGSHGSLWL